MQIEILPNEYTVCKVAQSDSIPWSAPFLFIGKTDHELSLVCPVAHVPAATLAREDGWRAMRVAGQMEFALVGILARISGILAAGDIPIFAVSTYDTDYILVKKESFTKATSLLAENGYAILPI